MTDAFTDVLDEPTTDSSTDDGGTDTTTVTDASVRTTLPDADGTRNTAAYEDPDGNNEADDVDPRKLFQNPTLDELRYYYREGPFGGTVVEKPILDAFKHGFEVEGDNTEREKDDKGKIKDFLDDYLPYYFMAEIKSRRDGLAVLMYHVGDAAESAAEPITTDDGEHRGWTLWTVDNLSDQLDESTVAEHTEYDEEQIYVSEGTENGGIAVVDDISHPDHDDVIGYGVAPRSSSDSDKDVAFVHADRCQHFVWGEHVDGPVGNNLTGKHVGESVLTSILQPLKGAQMGYWAIKNILFRYSAPLHAVEPPDTWGQDEFDDAREKLDDLSMASSSVLPPGSELNVAEGVSEFDPTQTYEVLVESICAGTEITKSVLLGTQTGTLSSSETDLKSYFNQVQRLRTGRTEAKFREAVEIVSGYDQSTVPRVAGTDDFEIDWGPLFKPTDIEQAEGMVSIITAVTNGIKNYVLTPDEAREILNAKWAEMDTDVELGALDEDEWDSLDRINMNEAGQGAKDNENVNQENVRQNPQQQNGGGQPQGQTRSSSQPTRDSQGNIDDVLQTLPDDVLEDELDRRNDNQDE